MLCGQFPQLLVHGKMRQWGLQCLPQLNLSPQNQKSKGVGWGGRGSEGSKQSTEDLSLPPSNIPGMGDTTAKERLSLVTVRKSSRLLNTQNRQCHNGTPKRHPLEHFSLYEVRRMCPSGKAPAIVVCVLQGTGVGCCMTSHGNSKRLIMGQDHSSHLEHDIVFRDGGGGGGG